MARALSPSEKAGLVLGLCPNLGVYQKLASAVLAGGLTDSTVCAAGTAPTLRGLRELEAPRDDRALSAWNRSLYEIHHLEEQALIEDFAEEPLLNDCFVCLSRMPGGGAPWQGSWRRNGLSDVISALGKGGIIVAVEAHSFSEQRDWARTLLKSGCAFVQMHDGLAPSMPAA